MRARYYALTDLVSIRLDTSYNAMGDHKIEEVTSSRDANMYELQHYAFKKSHALYASKNPLRLFKSLAIAQDYANESQIYEREYKVSGRAHYTNPWYQHAVVEIFVDPSSVKELKETKETALKDDGYSHQGVWQRGEKISKPTDPKKTYLIQEMPNKPQNYIINRAWIKDLKPIELHTQVKQKYANMFAKNLDIKTILQSVVNIFQDYYKPGLFSCHWRHHKNQAAQITHFLKSSQLEPKDAYDFLFKERQRLMNLDKKLNKNGSFMRRLEYALKQLRDVIGPELDAAPAPIKRLIVQQ